MQGKTDVILITSVFPEKEYRRLPLTPSQWRKSDKSVSIVFREKFLTQF
jgi:hypothetical protein